MQGLSIIVATADAERFLSALELAAANAALERPTRLFLQAQAVRALMFNAVGVEERPSADEMLGEALALGVHVSACQTGLAYAGLEASQLPMGIETEGLVSFLASRGEDQLLIV
jgi:predicted peroxiredoxin